MLIGEGQGGKGVRGRSGDLDYVETSHGGSKDLLHMTDYGSSCLVRNISSVYGADHSKISYFYRRQPINSSAVDLTRGMGYDSPSYFGEWCQP